MKYIYIAILFILQLTELNSTPLSGVISSDLLLEKNKSPYTVASDLVIGKNSDVVIEQGAELIIAKNVNITVLGSIKSANDSQESITFKSDGSGNWGSIIFYSGVDQDTSRLSNIIFQNGGTQYHSPLMLKSEIVPTFSDIEFVDCSSNKLELTPFDFGNLMLPESDIPYLINNDLIVRSAAVLELMSGTDIYIRQNIDIICKGRIIADGNFENPVNFYSNDNARWGGISVESELLEQSTFKFCNFDMFGNSQLSSYAGITVVKGSAAIEYCSFNNFNRYAVVIKKDGLADLGGGYATSKGYNQFGEPNMPSSVILSNYSPSSISAQYNCWGSSDIAEIQKKIFDASDNSTVGPVDYSNYLDDCSVTSPPSPVLEYPYDGAEEMPTNLKCTWYNVQSAEMFHFQISEDSTFTDIVSYKDNLVDTFAIARNLKNGKRYYWRARSVNMAGNSQWSNFYSFKTFDTTKPEPPVLIYPKNKSVDIPTQLTAKWTEIENADKYVLQWSKNLSFTNPKYDTAYTNSLELTLKYDSEYFIRVKAGNKRGWSAWSLENQFVTAPQFSKQEIGINVNGEIKQSIPCYIDGNDSQDLALRTDNKIYFFVNTGNDYSKVFDAEIADINFDYADYNKDSYLDFIAISKDRKALIIENKQGNLSIFGQSLGENLDAAFFFDIDNNQSVDIITFSQSSNIEVNMFENIITGFVPAYNFKSNGLFSSIIKDDFDNDGVYDFLISMGASARIVNVNSDALVNKQSISFLTKPEKIIIRDIDADSYKDIISLEYDTDIACIYSYSISNNYTRMSLNKEKGIRDIDLIDLSNNGYYDFIISYADSIAIREYVNSTFFDFYTIPSKSDYISYCNIDNYNNDFFVKEANSYAVYKNNNDFVNAAPSAPTLLNFSISDNSIYLNWNSGSDLESHSLQYSLQISSSNDDSIPNRVLYDLPLSKSRNIKLENIKSGRYKWRVRTHDNTFLYSNLSEESEFITPDLILPPPESWNFEKQTGEHSILVINPDNFKDSVNMHSGMYVGVFYVNDTSLSCAGYAKYVPSHSTAIPIWGDNYITSMIKEGFEQKELIRYKLWDGIKGIENFIQIDLDLLKNQFLPDKVFKVNTAKEPSKLDLHHGKNRVSYLSSNMELCNPFISSFEGIQYFTANGSKLSSYTPFMPQRSLISMSDINHIGTLEGYKIDPTDYKIEVKKGWNLLPYLKSDTSTVSSAFEYYLDKIICVKDDEGNAYIPQFEINTLNYLTPGKAYMVYSFENFDFYYNNIIDDKYESVRNTISADKTDYFATGNSMSVILTCEDASDSSIVKIISSDKTVGYGQMISGTAYINIWGDNPFTSEIDGSVENANLIIEIYDKEQQKTPTIVFNSILDIIDSENNVNSLSYHENKIFAISVSYDETSVEQEDDYPYVFSNNTIESNKLISSFSIYNYGGIEIKKYNNLYNSKIDLSDLPSGHYFIRFDICGKTYTEKLIINK